ncbi:DUF4363 family protein [Sedimentibacter sp.]|uniref:DUF4363 family protein n=1 Tax=Sedimentibacter sp. TaxID=1960295 RepID=UPI0028A7E123|nr:DUF4363 family protein [Sedimentibacter sp.]
MKMLIISLIFLLLMIGIWIWYHFTSIEPMTDFYNESINDLLKIIENEQWEKADKDIRLYIDKWGEVKNIWTYFISQKNLDNIESSMKKTDVYIKNKDKIQAQAELEHMMILFNIIKENECLTISNIF